MQIIIFTETEQGYLSIEYALLSKQVHCIQQGRSFAKAQTMERAGYTSRTRISCSNYYGMPRSTKIKFKLYLYLLLILNIFQIPVLKEQLIAKEHHLNDMKNNAKPLIVGNWKDAIMEAKRQYEAIDRALEVN